MIEVKQVLEADLKNIVDVHKSAFKDFFLTQLGDHFLYVYYKAVLTNKLGVLIGCYENDKLLGFCAATLISKGFNKHLVINNIFSFLWIGLCLLFTRPKAIVRLLKNFTKSGGDTEDTGEYAELLSIGVSSETQGLGLGKKMLLQLEEILKNKKCDLLSLTTDYYNNEKAIGFYRSIGYKEMYDFITYPNRKMYRLIKEIK